MALNPNTMKALFGKLAPHTDDVAKGVASYGDDALRAVNKVDGTSGRTSLTDSFPKWKALEANDPGFDYETYLAQVDADRPEVSRFLDIQDAVDRVQSNIAFGREGRDASTQDLLTYTDNIPDIARYGVDAPPLADLYNELSNRYGTSKRLQEQFGSVPKSFPSNRTFEKALSDLLMHIEDIP